MANQQDLLCFFFCFLLLSLSCEPAAGSKKIVRVGVVLDLNSTIGEMAHSCMEMALSDFYALNANYRTRLNLTTRDSGNDVITAASAALDLIKNEEVHAIIGPRRSSQAKFVIDLGRKAKVPIISFAATSPSLSPTQNPFFVRTAPDDCSQVKAITAIVKAYGWREVILVYEDTDYGNGLIPYLTDAFQEIDTRVTYRSVIPLFSNDTTILEEMKKLKAKQTRIFLVHMTASLGSRLFVLANNERMMSEGYAWIVTEGLSTLLDPVGSKAMGSMQGVLGLRPYIQMSKKLESFKSKWMSNFIPHGKIGKITDLNLFGLWAYDTIWAVAIAVEKTAGIAQVGFANRNASKSRVDLVALGVSRTGPKLLNSLLSTKFQGLSGEFNLVKGQLQPSALEVFNVIGETERIIGYWTPSRGFSSDFKNKRKLEYSTSKGNLKQPIWPGDTTDQPTKLRIGVPIRTGFREFVDVEGPEKVSGFSNDVFLAVLEKLPFSLPYRYIPFNGTYDNLLYQIKLEKFDAVMGDTTIVANRSTYVDFTLPYSESGVSMVVLIKDDERKNMWIFLKPLSLNLWITTGAAFIFTGLVVWILEHRINNEFRGPPRQQLGTIFWFSFSTLVFAHREKVLNNWSRLVLSIWIFVVLILTQSYTASLTSMLTVQRMQPTFVDVKEIKKNDYYVGYQTDSFVRDLLLKQLNFNETKLRNYSSPEEYHEALSSGTHHGGVAAIFEEIPYIKLFLAKYCSKYTMVGPTYKTAGFGFAFPQGSPLVSYISRAILNVTEDKDKMEAIVKKNLHSQAICDDQGPTISSDRLSVYSFGGLFIITGVASMFSLLICVFKFLYSHSSDNSSIHPERPLWFKMVELAKNFDKKDLSSHPYKRNDSRIHPVRVQSPDANGGLPSSNFNEGEQNVVGDDDDEVLSSGQGAENVARDEHDDIRSSEQAETTSS